jgi:TRAP-type C4-dicarboxylate transport system permease small subunit
LFKLWLLFSGLKIVIVGGEVMLLLKRAVEGLNGYFLKIALLFTVLMMFVTVADVLMRFLHEPIPGVFELTRYALAVIVFASLGWSQMHKVHIAIDLFVSRIPALWQTIIDVFNYFLATVTFSLAFWQMLVYTGRLYSSGLVTTVLRVHVYPWVLVSAVGVLFFTLVLLCDFINAIYKLSRRGDN